MDWSPDILEMKILLLIRIFANYLSDMDSTVQTLKGIMINGI